MLDAERMVEAKFVAERKLAPQLLVTLVRRHAGLGPDMGEVGEFHVIMLLASGPILTFASRSGRLSCEC